MKSNSDCLFGPEIGQWHRSPSNDPKASHAVNFRVSGGSIGSVALELNDFAKWRAVKHLPSNSLKNRGETGIFLKGDVEIKDKG